MGSLQCELQKGHEGAHFVNLFPDSPHDYNEHLRATEPAKPTLRDQFAMEALSALLRLTHGSDAAMAKRAYEVADAMLEARKK